MKSELIRQIFWAFSEGDRDKFVDVAQDIIREEEAKNHHLLAKDLRSILATVSSGRNMRDSAIERRYKQALPIPRDNEKGFALLEVKEFYLDWDDIVLPETLMEATTRIVEEITHADLLATYGLRAKQRVLFCGPPGTGKTLSAQVLSSVLRVPLAYVRFDSIVSSFLGETASNLRKIFDFVEQGQWVVLFDEFDVIGKHRDDPREHGEIKRVVNNFMQMLDNYRGDSLLIAATNHQHLLDPGLWRRFDEILFFDIPDAKRRRSVFDKYLRVVRKDENVNLDLLVEQTEGFSPSDIAQICWEGQKTAILRGVKTVTQEELIEAIEQQQRKKTVEGRKNGFAK